MTTKMGLKLLIDKTTNKVLFAEAGKDFVDFLLSLLSLPVSTVIRLITSSSMVGCIGNLYKSLENLNEAYMQPNQNKDSLLRPCLLTPTPNVFLLQHGDLASKPSNRQLFRCPNHHSYVTEERCTKCPDSYCHASMSQEVKLITTNKSTIPSTSSSAEGYVRGLVTYMVTDDLSVSTMSMISGVGLLNKFNIKDFGALEEKVVEFGMDQGVELLKASLQSKAALTSVFLVKWRPKDFAASD